MRAAPPLGEHPGERVAPPPGDDEMVDEEMADEEMVPPHADVEEQAVVKPRRQPEEPTAAEGQSTKWRTCLIVAGAGHALLAVGGQTRISRWTRDQRRHQRCASIYG